MCNYVSCYVICNCCVSSPSTVYGKLPNLYFQPWSFFQALLMHVQLSACQPSSDVYLRLQLNVYLQVNSSSTWQAHDFCVPTWLTHKIIDSCFLHPHQFNAKSCAVYHPISLSASSSFPAPPHSPPPPPSLTHRQIIVESLCYFSAFTLSCALVQSF